MKIKYLLLLLFIAGIGCNNQKERFLYERPSFTVADTYNGRILGDNDSVFFSNMTLQVKIGSTKFNVGIDMGIGNKAYASMRKDKVEIAPGEKISNIKIISLYDYNNKFKAGADIIDSCVLKEGKSVHDRKSLIKRMNTTYSEYYYAAGGALQSLDITIKNPPSSISSQRFAIVFETENQSVLTDTTRLFTIKP
ncbi:hypothetical protein CAP35_05400 [Chitinophagaceae bacterium IBVUCB1]|nr:hypothetical protein CAP35_05400 [Chitinophagaceae bacterium IBVUCB1]